jgi:hypothetical protein
MKYVTKVLIKGIELLNQIFVLENAQKENISKN